jgi:hypothetical protein
MLGRGLPIGSSPVCLVASSVVIGVGGIGEKGATRSAGCSWWAGMGS